MCKLVVPSQLASSRIESNHRTRVQIIAWPGFAAEIGFWIPSSPIDEPQSWIVRAGSPGCYTAMLPRVIAPSLVACLAGTGHGVELPQWRSIRCGKSSNKAPDAKVTASDTDNDAIINRKRGTRHRIAPVPIADLYIPNLAARSSIQCKEMCIECRNEHCFAKDCDSSVLRAAT